MNIQFENKDLEDARKRKGKFQHVHSQIEKRLTELSEAENLEEIIRNVKGARCHERSGKQKGIFTVDLTGNWRLLFRPEETLPPLKADGGIDVQQVTSIIIIGIDDPHKR